MAFFSFNSLSFCFLICSLVRPLGITLATSFPALLRNELLIDFAGALTTFFSTFLGATFFAGAAFLAGAFLAIFLTSFLGAALTGFLTVVFANCFFAGILAAGFFFAMIFSLKNNNRPR